MGEAAEQGKLPAGRYLAALTPLVNASTGRSEFQSDPFDIGLRDGLHCPPTLDDLSKSSSPFCRMTVDILSSTISGMSNGNEELIFINNLCARTKELRLSVFPRAAEQMAIALGVPPTTYAKYETRTPLPHFLIPRFAAIVGESIEFVLTGRGSIRRARPAKPLRRQS